jgi:hypothetical protein
MVGQYRDQVFDVVWPLGEGSRDEIEFGERVHDLNGKTVAEVADKPQQREVFPVIREELKRRYPGVNIVEFPVFGFTHSADERQVVADLPEKLKEYGVDVVLSGLGT